MEIRNPTLCSECGKVKDNEVRFCCDYCRKEGAEKDFPIKITEWATYPMEDDNEYRHYCTFKEVLDDINHIIRYGIDDTDRFTIEINGKILDEINSLIIQEEIKDA